MTNKGELYDCPLWTPLYLHRSLLKDFVAKNARALVGLAGANGTGGRVRILDVGCGRKPFQRYFEYPEVIYEGADIAWAGTDAIYTIDEVSGRIDALDNTFDLIVCFQVLEHVPDARKLIKECIRLLRPGGYFFCTVPFAYHVHGVPGDYRRWAPAGIEFDLEQAGLDVRLVEPVENDFVSVLTIIELYVADLFGYRLTKPIFLCLNLIGLAFRHSTYRNIFLTVSATGQKRDAKTGETRQ
jgi:SAM-dependent methyltransferase